LKAQSIEKVVPFLYYISFSFIVTRIPEETCPSRDYQLGVFHKAFPRPLSSIFQLGFMNIQSMTASGVNIF